MKYTTPPQGHRWHNPENAPSPPSGWRYMLEAESDEGRNWNLQKVPCRIWKGNKWNERHNDCGAVPEYSYIVPDTTPFDIPDAIPAEEIEEDFRHGFSLVYAEIREAERLKLLREHYAGLAMQGYTTLVTPENVKLHREKGPKMPIEDYMALLSVQMADALIAALNKKEEVV